MHRQSQVTQSVIRNHTMSFKQLDHPLSFNTKPKTQRNQFESINEKLDALVQTFGKISKHLENGLSIQSSKINQFQKQFSQSVMGKLQEIINVNKEISKGIYTLININQIPKQSRNNNFTSQNGQESNFINTVSSTQTQIFNTILDDCLIKKNISFETPQITLQLFQRIKNPLSMQIKKSVSEQETQKTLLSNIVQAYLLEQTDQKPIKAFFGNFYYRAAEYYFNEYTSGRLSYQDMKIRFSYDLLDQTAKMAKKWHEAYYKQQSTNYENQNKIKIQFFKHYNDALKSVLRYLICKYPPSRRKIVDTQLSTKIIETKQFSIVPFDMLRNAGMNLGLQDQQTNFDRDIKLWINKLITETDKQFPQFKQTMKGIFMGRQSSIEGEQVIQVEYSIGRKIQQGTSIYSQCELGIEGLSIKNPQILRILMKWNQQLNSYFTDHKNKIFNNKFGFKNTKLLNMHIKLPQSRLQLLSSHLNDAYNRIMKQIQKSQTVCTGLLFADLLTLTVSGLQDGYQHLNNRQITILKFAQNLNQSLKSYVVSYLNYYLTELSKIRKLYDDDKIESNINLITFGVMDLLKCKCVASKSQIYRIYKEIVNNTDYFEIIRVKNKLNQSTRDILINLKLKNSFLICEVQLSLGQSKQEVNDHFCHYFYELERSSFSAAFESASQICNLDPRMTYIQKQKKIKLKGSEQIKKLISEKITVKGSNLICSIGHSESKMDLLPNSQPFACLLCANFIKSYSTVLFFARCRKCYTNLCHSCLIHNYQPQSIDFKKSYISIFIECQLSLRFFNNQYLQSDIIQSLKMKNRVMKHLQNYDYVMHMSVNGTGHIPIIYKKYKKTFIHTFATLIQPPKKSKYNILCWNLITSSNKHTIKKIHQLNNYKKYHMVLQWADLQQIFQQNNIDEVICILSQQSGSALIIDIIQTEQQIEYYQTKKEIKTIVQQCNSSNKSQIELTSKGLKTMMCLQHIKNKQNIKSINFWQNNIDDISIIPQFKNLTNIVFRQNKLKSMNQLLQLKQLQNILLCDNQIQGQLPILDMPHLKLLDLAKNNITSINNLSYSTLQQLAIINVSLTKITSLPKINAPKLFALWCQRNILQNIDFLVESHLPSLTKIMFTHGKIKTIPKMNFKELTEFTISHNEIESVSNFCQSQCPNLRIINFNSNKIQGQFPSFINFKSLYSLDASHNLITSIKNKTFDITSLTKLILNDNQISNNFPILKCQVLKQINLSNNKILNIDNLSLSKLPLLQILNISNNLITCLSTLHLKSLKLLNLSYNNIQYIDKLSDSKLPKVIEIKLNNNQISHSINQLYLQKLQVLDIRQNKITKLEFMNHLHLLTTLKQVKIQGNQQLIKQYQGKNNTLIILNNQQSQ